MSHFRSYRNLEPIHENFQTTVHNAISRVLIGLPRIFYRQIPTDVPIVNLFKVMAAFPLMKFLGVSTLTGVAVIFFLIIAFNLVTAFRLDDTLDQVLFNRYFKIDKNMEDKLIELTPDSHQISLADMNSFIEKYGKFSMEKYYKQFAKDNSFIGVFTHSMGYHMAQRGNYIYIWYFEFDTDEIFRCVSPYIVNKSDPDRINNVAVEEIKEFSSIDPSMYKVGGMN